MPLPTEFLTTTCSVYRGNPPPGGSSPAATNVPCQLVADFAAGARTMGSAQRNWTHYLLVNEDVDVRDSYAGHGQAWPAADADSVFVPSGGTTRYAVVFVEVRGKGTAGEHKRVYLDRQAPGWPSL